MQYFHLHHHQESDHYRRQCHMHHRHHPCLHLLGQHLGNLDSYPKETERTILLRHSNTQLTIVNIKMKT